MSEWLSQPQPPAKDPVPARCPFCRSTTIGTTSKVADADSYWRCRQCGEIWNDLRLANQSAGTRRW